MKKERWKKGRRRRWIEAWERNEEGDKRDREWGVRREERGGEEEWRVKEKEKVEDEGDVKEKEIERDGRVEKKEKDNRR